MLSIVVFPENRQDLYDIENFIRCFVSNCNFKARFILCLDDVNIKYTESMYYEVYIIKRNGMLSKSFFLMSLFKKIHFDVILTGAVKSYIRLFLFFINYRVVHISYYRAMLINPYNLQFLSDWLYFFTKKINFDFRFFKNYYSDYVITIGELNKRFLLKKGYNENQIILLKNSFDICDLKSPFSFKRNNVSNLVILTQAYRTHNLCKLDDEQYNNISSVCCKNVSLSRKVNVVVKRHPRDFSLYPCNVIDDFSLDKFPVTNTIIASPPSTFGLELMKKGYFVVFFETDLLRKYFKPFYELPGIKSFSLFEIYDLLNNRDVEEDLEASFNVYPQVFETKNGVPYEKILCELLKKIVRVN